MYRIIIPGFPLLSPKESVHPEKESRIPWKRAIRENMVDKREPAKETKQQPPEKEFRRK